MQFINEDNSLKKYTQFRRVTQANGEKHPRLFCDGEDVGNGFRGNITGLFLGEPVDVPKKDGGTFKARDFRITVDHDCVLTLNYISDFNLCNIIASKLYTLDSYENISLRFYYYKGKSQCTVYQNDKKISPSYGNVYEGMPESSSYESAPRVLYIDSDGKPTDDIKLASKDDRGYLEYDQVSKRANAKFFITKLQELMERINNSVLTDNATESAVLSVDATESDIEEIELDDLNNLPFNNLPF